MDEEFWTGPRKAAAAVAALAAIAGAVAGAQAYGLGERLFGDRAAASAAAPAGLSPQGAAVAAELERLPDVGGMYREMRASYPDDYRAFVEALAAAADARGQAGAEQEAFEFMRRFMAAKVEASAKAPDADLQRIARANVGVVESLQRSNPALCAQYVTVGFSQSARPDPETLERLGAMNVLQLRAARAGEQARVEPRPQLSPADAQAWFRRMEAIDRQAAAWIQSGEVERLGPAEQCAAGLVLYRAAADLPPEQSAAVTVHIMRSAIQPAQ